MPEDRQIEVSAPQDEILSSCEQFNLFLAGVGSGKSHVAGLLSADFVLNHPHVCGFIGANTLDQLSGSTLRRVFKVWEGMFGWKRDINYRVNITPPKEWIKFGEQLERYNKVITFDNGAVIFTGSMDNYSAIDGAEWGWCILDETKDTKEEAVTETVIPRVRQVGLWINKQTGDVAHEPKPGYVDWNPRYFLTSPAKVDWLNEMFNICDQEIVEDIHRRIFSKDDFYQRVKDGQKVVISSTYHNEGNLPKNYIPDLLSTYAGNQNRINMLIYGSPVAKTGGEYYSGFGRDENVKACPYLKDAPIHAAFDFNVNPYMSCLLFQVVKVEGVYHVRFFDEIICESPKNNTEATCLELEGKYLAKNPKGGLFYTGDATGKNKNTATTEHNYDVIRRTLFKYVSASSDRTLIRNPNLIQSRDFVNKLLAGGFPNIEVFIDPRCKKLIIDLEFLKEGPDGGPLKQVVKDKVNGTSYQKYGHVSDAFKYGLIATFNTLYEQ